MLKSILPCSVTFLLFVSLLAWKGQGVEAGHQPPAHPTPVVNSPDVPPDVLISKNFAGNPIAFFDDYSWRAFIAVIWPG